MRHRIARIESKIHDDLLDLSGIGFDGAEVVRGNSADLNVFSNEPAKQGVEIQDRVVQVDDARR